VSKNKTVYYCQNCGASSPKWIGRCPSCGEWNTYVEEVVEKQKQQPLWNKNTNRNTLSKPVMVKNIEGTGDDRIITTDQELNRVLGGGIVPGSLILIGGEPGIGKSTLLLQLALQITDTKVMYISGEESEQQIKMRADRIGVKNELCFVLSETSTANIFQQLGELKPHIVIVDSIQTMQSTNIESTTGSISQIKECTGEFQRFAKETGTPVFLVGHITKDGNIVLQFEGDQHYTYRILRTIKNRFGSASELGIYEMQGEGLRQVSNPSEIDHC